MEGTVRSGSIHWLVMLGIALVPASSATADPPGSPLDAGRGAGVAEPAPPEATATGWIPTALLAGALATLQFAVDPPENSRWTDRNSFDSAIRRGLKGNSRSARASAATASDVVFAGMGVALLADWWWLRGEYGFWRSAQVDTRWLLADNVATRVAKISAGRQRPYAQPCGRNDDYVPSCGSGRDRNGGFFSGHASNTATLAGLLCARHLRRQQVGAADWAVCGGAAAGALATGALRIVSEHHFATDVLAGWAAGAVFGYLLPAHFDYERDSEVAIALRRIAPVVAPGSYGLRYSFDF